MIVSMSNELYEVQIPHHDGEMKMLPFNLSNLEEIPEKFKELVKKMIEVLPIKNGIAYLTVDGKVVSENSTHRRGGVHIDGNYLQEGDWGNSGGGNGGWKVGEGGRKLNSEEHALSYLSENGGMLITSNYPACKGFNGVFEGFPNEGGDCTHIQNLGDGFMLKPNTVYYGNSQWLHESLKINKTVHRTIVRITLPTNYPLILK